MAGKEYWSPLTRGQYEDGRDRRLHADEIEPSSWYSAAHIGHPLDDLSCYAVEYLVEAASIRPIDDLFVIDAYLLDADGRRVGKGDSLIKPDGLIIDSSDASAEGYLLDAAEKLGLGPLVVNETVLLQR
jgi:hypothetical protein